MSKEELGLLNICSINMTDLPLNHNAPIIMHVDLNSCFATIEQQANPLLRGKPIVVAAYDSPNGCVIAPSIDYVESDARVPVVGHHAAAEFGHAGSRAGAMIDPSGEPWLAYR